MTGIFVGFSALAGVVFGWEAAVVAAAVAAVVLVVRADRRSVAPGALLVVAVAIIGSVRHQPPGSTLAPPWIDSAGAFRGVVASPPTRTDRAQSFVLDAHAVETADSWTDAAVVLCVVGRPQPRVALGDRVWLAGQAGAIADEPARFRPWLRGRGCAATSFAAALAVDEPGSGWRRAAAEARDAVSLRLRQLAPGDAGALMSGLVTGDDSALSSPREAAFRRTGTTHITAVSGSNFATLVTVLVAAGAWGGWRRRVPWLVLVVVLIWGYAIFTGLQPPGARAAIVASFAVLAVRAGRRADVVTLLALAGGGMALVDPAVVGRLAFGLSLAASLALASVADPEPGEERGVGRWLALALLATVVAQVATLPLLLPVTRFVSLASLPANVAVAPLVAVAYPASLIASLLAWTPVAEVAALPARLSSEAILAVVDAFATIPGAVALGTVSATAVAVIGVGCAGAVLALSRDGLRAWSMRRRWATARLAPVAVGASCGAIVAFATWVITR